MCDSEAGFDNEVTVLRLRILSLQAIICDLLDKNERLRLVSLSVQDSQAVFCSSTQAQAVHSSQRELYLPDLDLGTPK